MVHFVGDETEPLLGLGKGVARWRLTWPCRIRGGQHAIKQMALNGLAVTKSVSVEEFIDSISKLVGVPDQRQHQGGVQRLGHRTVGMITDAGNDTLPGWR